MSLTDTSKMRIGERVMRIRAHTHPDHPMKIRDIATVKNIRGVERHLLYLHEFSGVHQASSFIRLSYQPGQRVEIIKFGTRSRIRRQEQLNGRTVYSLCHLSGLYEHDDLLPLLSERPDMIDTPKEEPQMSKSKITVEYDEAERPVKSVKVCEDTPAERSLTLVPLSNGEGIRIIPMVPPGQGDVRLDLDGAKEFFEMGLKLVEQHRSPDRFAKLRGSMS